MAQQTCGMRERGAAAPGKPGAVSYALVDSPVGRVLLACTERGVCSLLLGRSDGDLEAALARRYPAAALRREDAALRPWLAGLREHLEGRRPVHGLPLDLRGTAFQRRVWEELCRIPYGGTRTYKEVAAALGRPAAFRAVARACGANPVAVLVPCHRVVRSDGGLGGYTGGLAFKVKLLGQERNGRPT